MHVSASIFMFVFQYLDWIIRNYLTIHAIHASRVNGPNVSICICSICMDVFVQYMSFYWVCSSNPETILQQRPCLPEIGREQGDTSEALRNNIYVHFSAVKRLVVNQPNHGPGVDAAAEQGASWARGRPDSHTRILAADQATGNGAVVPSWNQGRFPQEVREQNNIKDRFGVREVQKFGSNLGTKVWSVLDSNRIRAHWHSIRLPALVLTCILKMILTR